MVRPVRSRGGGAPPWEVWVGVPVLMAARSIASGAGLSVYRGTPPSLYRTTPGYASTLTGRPAAVECFGHQRAGEQMPIIEAHGLTKTYRVFQKQPGLWGAVRGLFRRHHKEVHAVADVSFSIRPGEMV